MSCGADNRRARYFSGGLAFVNAPFYLVFIAARPSWCLVTAVTPALRIVGAVAIFRGYWRSSRW